MQHQQEQNLNFQKERVIYEFSQAVVETSDLWSGS